jgi:predicted dehydrogenase
MRFLICGLGSIGRRHLRNLRELGQDDIVLLRTGKSTLPADELNGFPEERELTQALERWRPDAVLVTNPTALHMQVAIPAAEAGCHLFLEKPIGEDIGAARKLLRIVMDRKLRVLVGFQFRYSPGLQMGHQWLQEGAIGRPTSARAHWGEYLPGWHPWEDYRRSYSARSDLGGGVVLTLCHPFDYLRWLMGEVVAVVGQTGQTSDLDLDVEDTAEAILTFENGALGHVHLDYNQQPPSHWLEITGTEGTMAWDQETGEAKVWRLSEKTWEVFQPPGGFNRDALFLQEMEHFLAVVKGEAAPRCTLEDGFRALEIALAVRTSSDQGRRVELAWRNGAQGV